MYLKHDAHCHKIEIEMQSYKEDEKAKKETLKTHTHTKMDCTIYLKKWKLMALCLLYTLTAIRPLEFESLFSAVSKLQS